MSVGRFLTRGGWAAAAIALTASLAPAQVLAEARNRGDRIAQQRADDGDNSAMAVRGQRVQAAHEARAARQAEQQRVAQAERTQTQARGQGARQADRGGEQAARQAQQRVAQAERTQTQARWQGAREAAQRADQAQQPAGRNRSYADPGRNRDYAARSGEQRRNDGRRDNNWQGDRRDDDRDRNWQGNRRDNDGWRGGGRNDDRRWDRNWRNDNRYDWQRYRNGNRTLYRVEAYHAPYRSYSYRRYGVGATMGSLFYGSSYWITNPWQYRLPDVWGPYRWVRYYDDVLLVDVYSGQVVDVIYNFFW